MFSSRYFRKYQGSRFECFRRWQESWRPITCNASCNGRQDFWQRCDCSWLAKLQTHHWVKSLAFTAATADNSLSAAKVACQFLGSSGSSQKTPWTLLGLPSRFPPSGKKKKGGPWFLFCFPRSVKLHPDSGAWKLLCHPWFRKNLVAPGALPCLWTLSEYVYRLKSLTKHHWFKDRWQPKLWSWGHWKGLEIPEEKAGNRSN